MAYEPICVFVDGQRIQLVRGCEVKHALNWAGGHRLVAQVQSGKYIVWDETADAQTDLGGALYDGQRLSVRPR